MGQAGTNRQLGLFNQDNQEMVATTTTAKIGKCPGIPIYKVSLVRESKMHCYDTNIRSSDAAGALLQMYLADVDRERFVILLLNRKNQVIGLHTVSIGSVTASIVHPREVYKVAILANATAIICGHNHPSGDPAPSTEDRALTARLVESGKLLGIEVLDHIIVGDGSQRYFRLLMRGCCNTTARPTNLTNT